MNMIKQKWEKTWISEIKKAKKDLKNKKTFYKQIPNLLTISRLLSPLIILPVAFMTNVLTTFIVIAVFALTDLLDGKIARKWKIESKLGALLDPVTDKIFAFTILLPNITKFPIITCTFLILECIIGFINLHSTLKGNHPKSSMIGKTKTTFLFISATFMYLHTCKWINKILPFLFVITIILQLLAAITYFKIDQEKETL